MSGAQILIIDDDLDTRDALGTLLAKEGYVCELASSAAIGLEKIGRHAFDLVLCDVRMTGMDGFALLDHVKSEHPWLPVILFTGMGTIQDAVDAIKRGAFQYLIKPYDPDELRLRVSSAITGGRLLRDDGAGKAPRTRDHHESIEPFGKAPAPAGSPRTLRYVTQAYTEQVLAQMGGNKQRAAEILDVNPSTLYRWQRARRA